MAALTPMRVRLSDVWVIAETIWVRVYSRCSRDVDAGFLSLRYLAAFARTHDWIRQMAAVRFLTVQIKMGEVRRVADYPVGNVELRY